MEGLVPGRIVYYVLNDTDVDQITRRRTIAISIAERMKKNPPQWPAGAQAHIGNTVSAGDIVPAMVVAVFGSSPNVNLKVMLDGSDTYWVPSAEYDPEKKGRSWHWMFDGQQKRYTPDAAKA